MPDIDGSLTDVYGSQKQWNFLRSELASWAKDRNADVMSVRHGKIFIRKRGRSTGHSARFCSFFFLFVFFGPLFVFLWFLSFSSNVLTATGSDGPSCPAFVFWCMGFWDDEVAARDDGSWLFLLFCTTLLLCLREVWQICLHAFVTSFASVRPSEKILRSGAVEEKLNGPGRNRNRKKRRKERRTILVTSSNGLQPTSDGLHLVASLLLRNPCS